MKKQGCYTPGKRSAFTLIELLVVIAIIAILAAILFPVFAQAREKARAITCISNEKQIGLGLMQYIQDFDEVFPMDQYYVGTDQVRWFDTVNPYIKNGDHFAFNGRSSGFGGIWHCPSFPSDQGSEYGVHLYLMPDGQSCPWVQPGKALPEVPLSTLQAPADQIVVMEKGQNNGNDSWLTFVPDEWNWTDSVGNPPGSYKGQHWELDQSRQHDCDLQYSNNLPPFDNYGTCGGMPRWRHNGMMNALFCDGHAKAIPKGGIDWYKNLYISSLMGPTW